MNDATLELLQEKDIVERLRVEYQRTILEYVTPDKLLIEAADEIERLRERVSAPAGERDRKRGGGVVP